MASIDNLNFYSNGLPAGQLTDKYSTQPGCLRSKNLDIFSSSKSTKATAWSNPTTTDADVIKQDGKLVLKTDGKVYERVDGVDTLFIDPNTDMPVYQVNYDGTGSSYADAIWGTPQDMVAKYEGNEWKSFVVYTDRAALVYSKTKYVASKEFDSYGFTMGSSVSVNGYKFTKSSTSGNTCYVRIKLPDVGIVGSIPVRIYAYEIAQPGCHISLSAVKQLYQRFVYDPELDQMASGGSSSFYREISFSGDILTSPGILVNVPCCPTELSYEIELKFEFTSDNSSYDRSDCTLYVDVNGGPGRSDNKWRMTLLDGTKSDGDYNHYYSYLPLRERKLTHIGEYYWMKGTNFQILYNWIGTWIEVNGVKKIRYDFVQYMGWDNDITMDVIGMIVWNENVYMIGNMDGNGYIFPCDLSGGRGTPYIAYGCEFKGVTNIDYLMYLVGNDRGISQLWVYNGQEMVAILGGTIERDKASLLDEAEQYKFDGRMVEYRDDLILTTSDNRIFQYGQTFGGKGGAFVHEIPGTITDLKADGNDLTVEYSVTSGGTTTKYLTKYQDDTPVKNYNTEWVAEYPIVLGNHLLEKEESDLYASYIIPSYNSKLEFWGMANHYHFWTFTSSDSYTFSTTASYKMKGCTGNYVLKYIETNGDQYTFRLEGDLPIQTTNDMKITDTGGTELITYSDFNHFRKIGEITTTEYQEGEFRFHNLNNKLELPKSHSLQIMVKGKGTANYTPELFALDLVANQRERG